MNQTIAWLTDLLRGVRPYVVVMPWERAVRVRMGARTKLLGPGVHVKWPGVDAVSIFNSRLRIAVSTQTLTTTDSRTLTLSLIIGFRIADPLVAMLTMQQPETTCGSLAASAAAEYVSGKAHSLISSGELERRVKETLEDQGRGLEFEFVSVRDFAFARTYRLLTENTYCGGAVHIEERVA